MKILFSIIVFVSALSQARAEDFESWLEWQRQIAEREILENISPAGARRGALIASPSTSDPNYYYHWVRDAALVMDIWMRQLEGASRRLTVEQLEGLMWDFVDFTSESQKLSDHAAFVGLGEPRYNVDGYPNLEPWGRPQNDGPGLRAALSVRFARYLMATGRTKEARLRVWPTIQRDLRYTGDQVYAISFDLWEEVKGDHFYTRLACREGLLMGADLAADLGEPVLAAWYSTQAAVAESLAKAHFQYDQQQVIENTHRDDWSKDKSSGLDTATLLGLLHTTHKPLVPLDYPLVRKTLQKLEDRFQTLYTINQKFAGLGTAIGRYPEDYYYGGNPWFLTTFAFAEYYYRLGDQVAGDRYMKRARFHAGRDGHMAEQMGRDHGYMLSAADLTWSYAAFLTAYEARRNFASK